MNRFLIVISLLATFGLGGACGSESKPVSGSATGGASAAGGHSGTGGGGVLGAAGAAGTSGVVGCNASNTTVAPADGIIATFMDANGGIEIGGGVYGLVWPPMQTSVPFMVTSGFLHMTPSGTMAYWVVVYFDSCIDASAFSGVQFSISGSSSGCTVEYKTEDSVQLQGDLPFGGRHGICSQTVTPGACGGQAAAITTAQITTFPQTLKMPFVDGPFAGSPRMPVDRTKLTQLVWQFTASPSCVTDITVDDIKFY
jgi:hypothetical protein